MNYTIYDSEIPLTMAYMVPFTVKTEHLDIEYDKHIMYTTDSRLDILRKAWVVVDSYSKWAYMVLKSSKTGIPYLSRLSDIESTTFEVCLIFRLDTSSVNYFQIPSKDRDWKFYIYCQRRDPKCQEFAKVVMMERLKDVSLQHGTVYDRNIKVP